MNTGVLCGLVVCGGASSRMGTDKSLLTYHNLPQRYHVYHMLKGCCNRVYISCRLAQVAGIPAEYATLTDLEQYTGMGPLTAILSAHKALPGADLLVAGCDYPLIATADLELLIERAKDKTAAFVNEDGFAEPLLAIYRSADLDLLADRFESYGRSLRRFLTEQGTLIPHPQPIRLTSVDTPEEYQRIRRLLQH